MDMDPSYSNINEVYYDGQMEEDTQMTLHKAKPVSDIYDTSLNHNDPLSPNYYQDQHYQQNSYNFMKTPPLARNPAYHNYQITNDHRGQYVLKRQDVNTNLISSNER